MSFHSYRVRQISKTTVPPNPNFNSRVFPPHYKLKMGINKQVTKTVKPQNKNAPGRVYNGKSKKKK